MAARDLAGAQKGARQQRRTIVFVDESGFYLLPGVARTYAPRGRTPVLRVHQTRDHLSAISGVTPGGRLFFTLRDRALHGGDVVAFLRHLLRQTRRRLLVIWDGGPIHRSRVVRAFLASRAGRRVQVAPLPGYAPELNPDELVWRYLKHIELRNRCYRNHRQLARGLHAAVRRLRRRRSILAAFVRHLDPD